MAKITDYPAVAELNPDDVLLKDGIGGTKIISARDAAKALLALLSSREQVFGLNMGDLIQTANVDAADKMIVGTSNGNKAISVNDAFYSILDSVVSVEQKRNIFRGENLGTALTTAQKTNISNGTFKGFFLGDYWTIVDQIWRIVDINYWFNTGDTPCVTPHLVIMPDSALYDAQMNADNITTGGYTNSAMYKGNLGNAKTLINSAFGSANILSHRERLTNAVLNGHASDSTWFDSTVELPNEIMMYGSPIFTNSGNGTTVPVKQTIDKTQLSLMRLHPKFINPSRQTFWLRDIVSSTHFANVNGDGYAGYGNASTSIWVRPVFGLKG